MEQDGAIEGTVNKCEFIGARGHGRFKYCTCEKCGAEFTRPLSHIARGAGRFCSWKCLHGSRRGERIERPCVVCGQPFLALVPTGKRKMQTICGSACWRKRFGDPKERLWSRVRRGPGCWEWTGGKDPDGYGVMKFGGKSVRVIRLAYLLHYGEDPGNKLVCHTCDNPTCMNPAHFWLGTQQQNQADKVRKGRQAKGATWAPKRRVEIEARKKAAA